MKARNSKVLSDLKTAIAKQITPTVAPPAPPKAEVDIPAHSEEKSDAPASAPVRTVPAPRAAIRSGRGVQFYLDDKDRKLISNLAMWLGSQDRRVSDSQVVKTAIRFASIQPNTRLLEICDEVKASDRRRAKSKKTPGTQ